MKSSLTEPNECTIAVVTRKLTPMFIEDAIGLRFFIRHDFSKKFLLKNEKLIQDAARLTNSLLYVSSLPGAILLNPGNGDRCKTVVVQYRIRRKVGLAWARWWIKVRNPAAWEIICGRASRDTKRGRKWEQAGERVEIKLNFCRDKSCWLRWYLREILRGDAIDPALFHHADGKSRSRAHKVRRLISIICPPCHLLRLIARYLLPVLNISTSCTCINFSSILYI